MMKQLLALFLVVSVVRCSLLRPRDLADEAIRQLDELEAIVNGAIAAALTEIDNAATDYSSYSTNVQMTAVVSLQTEAETIEREITQVKSLAQAAGANITTCTDGREDLLNIISIYSAINLGDCIENVDGQVSKLTDNTKDTVRSFSGKVNQLKYQISRCQGNILCISPLLVEVEMDKIKLPQKIKAEILAVQSVINNLKIITDNCSHDNIAQYITLSNTVLEDIVACANKIIG